MIIALIVVLISFYVLTQTVFGRQIYALGGNREAVRLSGINVNKLEIKTYVINGALAAIGAVILVGRLNAAQPVREPAMNWTLSPPRSSVEPA